MKIASFLAPFFLALCVSVLQAQPKIQVTTGTTIDMGDVDSGSKVERVAVVKNAGKDTLLISDVKAQCGCTATLMTERRIAPGDSGRLSISFNTAGVNGHASKEVYVSSNDTTNPRLTIRFSANVVSALDISPRFITFDNAKMDTTFTKMATVTNPSQKDAIKILKVTPMMEGVTATLMKNELMPGDQTQLQIVYAPTKSGNFNGTVELETDHKVQKKIEVKVFGFVTRK